MPAYYSQTIGFSLGLVGVITTCGRLFDIGADVTVGMLADFTRSRFGRRRIWIVLCAPLMLVAMWRLYAPSPTITPFGALMALALFYVFWTGMTIPYQAQAAEITKDYRSRNRIVFSQGVFLAIAAIGSIGLPFLALDRRTAELRGPLTEYLKTVRFPGASELLALLTGGEGVNALQFGPLLKIVAVVTTVSLFATLIFYLAVVPDSTANARASPPSLSWRLLKSNGPLHRLLAGQILIDTGTFWFVGLMPFYLAYVLRLADLVLLANLIQQSIGILMTPLWSAVANRVGRARTFVIGAAMSATGLIALWFMPPGHEGWTLAVFAWLGAPFLTIVMVPYSLGADAADYLHWRTGHESAAVHMSMISLVAKTGVAMGSVALIAVSFAGFDPAQGGTSGLAVEALRLCSTLVPAALTLVGCAIVLTFPITESCHRAIRTRLERRESARRVITTLPSGAPGCRPLIDGAAAGAGTER
jgi:Na+/melibiose symporter-like transporter